jgi:hypothetical protein
MTDTADFDDYAGDGPGGRDGGRPDRSPAATAPDRCEAGGLTSADDLSAAVALWVDREPLDRVRCVRVFAGHYRCNWWAPSTSGGGPGPATAAWWSLGVTHTIRQSRMLVAAVDRGRLVVAEAPGRRGSRS